MSETNVLSIASNVLQASGLAAKVSVRLFGLSRVVRLTAKPTEALSKDVASIGAVLNQLGRQLRRGKDVQVGSSTLVTSVDDLVEECSTVLESIDKALNDDKSGCKVVLGLKQDVQLATLETKLRLLEMNLERFKTPLALMLNVLIYAEQLKRYEIAPNSTVCHCTFFLPFPPIGDLFGNFLTYCSQTSSSLLRGQQELIKLLNDERKEKEKRFYELSMQIKTPSAKVTARKVQRTETPSFPEKPVLDEKDEEIKVRPRVWIRDDLSDQEDPHTEKPSSTSRPSPASIEAPIKVRGEVRNVCRTPDVQDVGDHNDDGAQRNNMAGLPTSTGLDTPHDSGEDNSQYPIRSKSLRAARFQPRDPVVKGDSSGLIDFIREGSPTMAKSATLRTPRSATPLRKSTEPMTPPPTAHEDYPDQCSLRPHAVPMQPQFRSFSAALPSPLGSHPPEPQFDRFRPAANKWPLQTVLAWLEKNSFSAEWQRTFRVLQIEGSEFIELESGQSIRKMLSVVYPQLASEYSETGRNWDQVLERAEGQRLRNLIRDLPAKMKYEDGASTAAGRAVDAYLPGQKSAGNVVSGALRRAVTSPPSDTRKTTNGAQGGGGFGRANVPTLQEADWNLDLPATVDRSEQSALGHKRLDSTTSSVPEEWVRRWTILSADEIARGNAISAT
jgi:hypothetical protein